MMNSPTRMMPTTPPTLPTGVLVDRALQSMKLFADGVVLSPFVQQWLPAVRRVLTQSADQILITGYLPATIDRERRYGLRDHPRFVFWGNDKADEHWIKRTFPLNVGFVIQGHWTSHALVKHLKKETAARKIPYAPTTQPGEVKNLLFYGVMSDGDLAARLRPQINIPTDALGVTEKAVIKTNVDATIRRMIHPPAVRVAADTEPAKGKDEAMTAPAPATSRTAKIAPRGSVQGFIKDMVKAHGDDLTLSPGQLAGKWIDELKKRGNTITHQKALALGIRTFRINNGTYVPRPGTGGPRGPRKKTNAQASLSLTPEERVEAARKRTVDALKPYSSSPEPTPAPEPAPPPPPPTPPPTTPKPPVLEPEPVPDEPPPSRAIMTTITENPERAAITALEELRNVAKQMRMAAEAMDTKALIAINAIKTMETKMDDRLFNAMKIAMDSLRGGAPA